jgi:hypothetical protein
VKRICRYLPLLVVLLFSMPFVHAQSGFDLAVGFGAAQDKASSTQVDQNLQACTVNDIAPPCVPSASLSTFMLSFGGDLMLWKKFGVGADVSVQPSKQTFVNLNASAALNGVNTLALQSRMTLYDFNGIFQPVKTKKVALKLIGGIGGANLKFYESGSSSSIIGSQNFSQYFQSSNHFQVHGGVGVQIYLTDHIFVRPQFDVHYVHNLTEFGRNVVTEETVWLGYTLGGQ